ncbi:MAG TPA: protein kinase [Polyangia bacterium]|nr:protein kinase [Polyangia bacterium]
MHGAPPPAPPPPPDATTPYVVPTPELDGFHVRMTLGQGGFGAVFLAERAPQGETVAIKVARADNASASEALVREADALSAVGPPHVPIVHARGRLDDGSAYLVMEFVRAPVLADRLAELPGQMEIDEFAGHALAMLTVVEAAHQRDLVHCDLKPENVFIDPTFGAKLFDFGLVRNVSVSARRVDSTKEEAPAGTPEYMSPEQCEGRTDIDARSDVYALGAIFYEMLTGTPPFWGNSAEVQESHRSRRPPALSRSRPMAPALEDAVLRCLAKDPGRRFADVTELRRALSAGLMAERARREATSTGGAAATAGSKGTAAGGKPAAAARERRTVALLFFETKSNLATIREAASAVGAEIAHSAGTQVVLAFGHEVGDNPTRAATAAAQMVIARGLTARTLVDLAMVSIQARPDGSRRYTSPLFTKKERYPTEADPSGVLLSLAAIEVLPDVASEPLRERPDVVLLSRATDASERTTTRMGVSPLVGRDELLRTLLDAARGTAAGGRPTIATLLGESGFGKTHFVQMLVQHLDVLPQVQTLFVRAKEVLGGAGEQTTRELLQRLLALPDAAPPDLGRALLADKLGSDVANEVWAGVAVVMGWAPPEHPELQALAAAPGAIRSAAARAVGEGLRRMARQRPLAMVIDDAHFVDETALDAIEYAALKEAEAAIWVLVVGRPSFGRGRTGWAGRAAERQSLTLGALEPPAAAELARRLLSPVEKVPSSALAKLAERTMGVPLLLVELVRGLKRDGVVRKNDKGTWVLATDELERLPDLPLVQWLASRETESLPGDLLAHARLASVLGSEFSADEIEGVLQELERAGIPPETPLDASIGVRRLTESGVLSRHRGGRVAFRHSLLRDTVYQSVPAAQRESIHRAAYEHYRRHDDLADVARLPQMAFHAGKSGLRGEAARLYLDLAHRASTRHAYLEAELLYRNALENLPETESDGRIAGQQGLGLMRFRLGRHDDALKNFAAAEELARKVDARAALLAILLDEGIVFDFAQDLPKSRARSEEADGLVAADAALGTPTVMPRLFMARGRTHMRRNEYPEAIAAFRQAIDAAEKVGDDGYEALTQSLSMLSATAANSARYEDADEAMSRCLRIYEEHGDMIGLAVALQNRCVASYMTGNVDRFVADMERIIQIAREFGFTMSECLAVRDLAELYLTLGRIDEAVPLARRALEMYQQELGPASRLGYLAEVQLARMFAYEGDVTTAAEITRRIVAVQAAAQAEGRNDLVFVEPERILLDGVDFFVRGEMDAKFDALAERGRVLQLQPPDIVELMEWKALSALRTGRDADGKRLLAEALAAAEGTIAFDRVTRRVARVAAEAAAPKLAGSAS